MAASRSTIQSAPHAHSMLSPMACSRCGVAAARVSESAGMRVTVYCIARRRSLRLRSIISLLSFSLAAASCLVRSMTQCSSSSAASLCSYKRRASCISSVAWFAVVTRRGGAFRSVSGNRSAERPRRLRRLPPPTQAAPQRNRDLPCSGRMRYYPRGGG